MTRGAVQELAARVAERYREAGPAEKSRILDDFCADTQLHRKGAIRLLGRPGRRHQAQGRGGGADLAEWEGVTPGRPRAALR